MSFAESTVRLDEACLRVFGKDVTYLPQAGGQTTIRVVFESTREPEDASPGVYAVLFVRLADLSAAPLRGDEIVIDGTTYKVFEIEADTSGSAVLRMRQV
jgi:hypothetical protein